ncbi:methyl-accepting chemotaxis protein [Salinicola aestuarinus]|uniref:methyl-accepting chemotaxis protein n=1 Tax=Salinicola aestuarinus TaxID=1949082 RepID=UPI000DA23CFB|nr:PAS domain-containing methyl-accepting chemotaxis protein [Salinicola aestuarinus]
MLQGLKNRSRHASLITALQRASLIVEFDAELRVTEANAGFLALLGYSRQALVGTPHERLVPEALANVADDRQLRDRLARGECVSGCFPHLTQAGETVWLEASYTPIRNLRGDVERVIKIGFDTTERASQAMTNQGRMLALDRSMASIEFDLDGIITDANENFLTVTGYTRDQLVGNHHNRLCTASHANSEAYRRFWQRLNEGEFFSGQFERVRADGSTLWLEATYNPIRDAQGRVLRVVKFASDITQRVLKQQAESQSAVMAYDISAQTQAISERGNDLLGQATAEIHRMAEAIHATSERIGRLQAQSKEIDTHLAAIRRVAEQTNLLALNAAIEAARAGEHGRGFGVVSHEVRQLAERAARTTHDIDAVIGEFKLLTEQANADMAGCLASVGQGVSLINDTGEIIRQVRGHADEVVSAVGALTSTLDHKASPEGRRPAVENPAARAPRVAQLAAIA